VALASPACGDDDTGPEEVFEPCRVSPTVDVTFDLDTANPTPQIHADFAFAAGQIWMAYNIVDGEGEGRFDVFLSAFECDGSIVGSAQRVTTTLGGNDIEPAISRRGDNLYIAWSSDNSGAENNLDALYRGFASDGTPLTDSDLVIETTLDGNPVVANTWKPRVAGLADGELALVGTRGIDNSFQTFIQRMTAEGEYLGEAIDVEDRGNTHDAPVIAATADGDLFSAWSRVDGNGDSVVWYGYIAADGDGFSFGPRMATTGLSSAPSLVTDRERGFAYLAVRDDASQDIVLMAVDANGEVARTPLGIAGVSDHSPIVVTSPTGGAVGWYRNVSGIRNRFMVQRFDFDGSTLTLAQEQDLGTDGAVSVYSPALTHIGDDIYFAAWSEGNSPEFFVKGRAVATR